MCLTLEFWEKLVDVFLEAWLKLRQSLILTSNYFTITDTYIEETTMFKFT